MIGIIGQLRRWVGFSLASLLPLWDRDRSMDRNWDLFSTTIVTKYSGKFRAHYKSISSIRSEPFFDCVLQWGLSPHHSTEVEDLRGLSHELNFNL